MSPFENTVFEYYTPFEVCHHALHHACLHACMWCALPNVNMDCPARIASRYMETVARQHVNLASLILLARKSLSCIIAFLSVFRSDGVNTSGSSPCPEHPLISLDVSKAALRRQSSKKRGNCEFGFHG